MMEKEAIRLLFMELLEKYEADAYELVGEFSGSIEKSSECVHLEIIEWRQRIDEVLDD